MARILKTYCEEEVLVWSVQLVTGRTNSTNKETSVFDQPVNKPALLVERELWKAMFKNFGQCIDRKIIAARD